MFDARFAPVGIVLDELTRQIEAAPEEARRVLVEGRTEAGGPQGRDELLDSLACCLDELLRERLTAPPSALAAAGATATIDAVLHSRLRAGEVEGLRSLVPALTLAVAAVYSPAAMRSASSRPR